MRCSLLALSLFLFSSNATALVTVGEISARADALPALRKAVEDEVAHVKVAKEMTVSVSLVRLDHGDCVVSAVLRDKSGSMFAMLEGRALGAGAQKALLETAVHGAFSRIPDASR